MKNAKGTEFVANRKGGLRTYGLRDLLPYGSLDLV